MLIRSTDKKDRVSLPSAFANATAVIEQVSDTELRIRKSQAVPEDEYCFPEGSLTPLSDRDRDLFLAMLDNPPGPTEALRRAAAMHRKRHG